MNKFKKKCIELAKKIAKERANYTCEKCGRKKRDGWQMHGAHIIPVEYSNTCDNVYNLLCLCARCHSLGKDSAHENPVPFSRWLEEKYPGRYDKLWEIAREIKPTYSSEWEERYRKLANLTKEEKSQKKKKKSLKVSPL